MTISIKRVAEIEAISDDEIDTSDIPEVSAAFFERGKKKPKPKPRPSGGGY